MSSPHLAGWESFFSFNQRVYDAYRGVRRLPPSASGFRSAILFDFFRVERRVKSSITRGAGEMEWVLSRELAAPPRAPATAPPCCAAHPTEQLVALAHGSAVYVFDTVSGACTLP